jgi:hypothetical protein
MKDEVSQTQLDAFIDAYEPEIGALAREVLTKMRERLPGAVQMVYDNYNALVIGFGATERASEAVFSIVVYPRWVSLCFLHGAALPDPENVLNGDGKQVRHIRLESAAVLDQSSVRGLMREALERAPEPLDESSPGRLVIKSISAKQRPRCPSS